MFQRDKYIALRFFIPEQVVFNINFSGVGCFLDKAARGFVPDASTNRN